MTDMMQALVYIGPNRMQLQTLPIPRPAAGEVLIRVAAVGICGSDMHAFHGHDERRPAPLILGHEAAGTIADGPREGQRVTINPLVVDPACPISRAGRPHLSPSRQIISMPTRPGAFAQFVTVPERNVLPIREDLDFAHAALAEPLAVSWHALRIGLARLDQDVSSTRVLVQGGGAIGLAAALVARRAGVHDVWIAEPNGQRRAVLDRQGGLSAYNPSTDSGPAEVDLVIDAVGAAVTRAVASRVVRPGGVIVHVGLLPGDSGLDVRRITLQEITVCGAYCYTPSDFGDTLAAIEARQLGTLDWIELRALADGPRAFSDLDSGTVSAAKIILIPTR